MTTLLSPSGGSEVINARRTESLDAPAILKLVQPGTEQVFGLVNVVNLIEKAVLAVTLSNEKDEVLGHAAFFDYPNVPNVDPAKWEEWMNTYYDCKKCTPLNTLFLHYFVAKQEYSNGAAREIIRTMFNAVPEMHFCFLVVPNGAFPDAALAGIFSQMDRLEGVKGPDGCVVFACHRHNHVPVLHIRKARVEDHDDLTPIFNRQSDMLKMTYGDFFLAELIEAQDDHMHCLVAEVDGTAIGFMSICDDVNADLLNDCFELGPYHGLRKPHEADELAAPKSPTPPPAPEPEITTVGEEQTPPSAEGTAKSVEEGGMTEDGSKVTEEKGTEKVEEAKSEAGRSEAAASKVSGSLVPTDPSVAVTGETKVKPKLSDANMGESTSSLGSGRSVPASAKSAVSQSGSVTKSQKAGEQPASRTVTPVPPTPQVPNVKTAFVPKYKGELNAFCIQLFIIDERFEMRSTDFLATAFELFPDRDFCVVTVPHLVPEFPLLQKLLRVTPRCPSILSQEMYLYHRAGLQRNFLVRPACSSDLEGIQKLVTSLNLHTSLLADIAQFNKARRDNDGTPIQAFVADCEGQIVGVSIIRSEEDIEYIRSHYNIEDFIYYNHHKRDEHGHLYHFALNPAFAHYSKQFLKECLRQGHKTCLYYPIFPSYLDNEGKHSLVSALNDMVPVRARRQISYPLERLGSNAPSDRVLQQKEKYALCHINRKLILEPKVVINARIVVVGASDTGIAFLETLAFCPHLRFNNLTLISPHGLPGELPPDEVRDQVLGTSHCYQQDDYAHISLGTWVNVVYGKMTAIDRKKKNVIVNNSTLVPYDHLIIATGTQYQTPAPTGADINKLATSNELPHSPDRVYTGTIPKNVYVINDQYDAAVALYWVEHKFASTDGKALVYGSSLDAYCCVQALLTMGLTGDRIVLVEPPLNLQPTCFNNETVETAILDSMKQLGVEVHSGYLLANWNDGRGGDAVLSASFTSNTKPLRLECDAFFSFYKKKVDYDAFRAINDACLVFDGKLVIDSTFHTNDVSIRGAGSLTKFQRKYHADQWTHANFNSKEVGIQLANTMLSLFDPTLEPESEPPIEMVNLIPMYTNPKIQGGVLPGGYHYLHVGKPSLNTPLEALMAQTDYGWELITGTPGGSPDYFRLHINQYRKVETVTCLSKKPIDRSNLMCLYSIHERYLNNLISRFEEGLIKDFYSYFRETWCLAIFHDRFNDFRDEVRELLITRPAADQEALEEKVRALIEEDLQLNDTQKKNLLTEFAKSGNKRAVETRLLSFLTYNYYHLPMYAKPGMV